MRHQWSTRLALLRAGCPRVELWSVKMLDSARDVQRDQVTRLHRTLRQKRFYEVFFVAICIAFFGEHAIAAEPGHKSSVKEAAREQITLKKGAIRLMEDGIFRLTNQNRIRRGLSALEPSPALRFLAQHQSRNMCNARLLAHESKAFPEGWQRFSERLDIGGVRSGAENVAFGTILKEPEQWTRMIMKGWMKSPEHRKSILNPKFRYLGIAVVPCKNNLAYATQVFSAEPGRTRQGQLTR
jgi:uncharacterized protein YkwD